MTIQIITSPHNANRAKGVTVVIDVLRAFTTTCYLFARGAKRIISITDLQAAYALKKNHPSYPLVGERGGVMPPDFDWGNSPAQLQHIPFNGNIVILTTTAGTNGLHQAMHAEEVITGAFVNAHAIARYIKMRKPQYVTLLCTNDRHPNNEDVMCARFIRSLLHDQPMKFAAIQKQLEKHPSADGFLLHPLTQWSTEDFRLCISVDTFDFVVRAKKTDPVILERI